MDHYDKNLENVEKKIEAAKLKNDNAPYVEEIYDFFFFRKQIEGFYQYHLFP